MGSYFWYDEAGWAIDAKQFNGLSYTPEHIPHFPLGVMIYSASYNVFHGILGETTSIRLVPFIFGIFQLLLIYHFAKKHHNIKTALIAIGIYTISFWAYISNVMVDQDGCIISFLVLAIMYLLVKNDYRIKPSINAMEIILSPFTLIGFLLSLLSMTRLVIGFIVCFVICVYIVFNIIKNKEDRFNHFLEMFLILTSFIMFLSFWLVILLGYNYDFYYNLILNSFSAGGVGYSLRGIMMFSYASVIFIAIYFVPFLSKQTYNKKNSFMIFFIGLYMFLVAGKTLDPGRYLMVLIPMFTIILADYLHNIPEKLTSFIIPGFISVALFSILNLIISKVPNGAFDYLKINNLLNMELGFVIAGSSFRPFYLFNATLFITFGLVLYGLFYMLKDKHTGRYLMIGSLLAFNVFLVIAYPIQNNISTEGINMIEFCEENCNLNKTFYVDGPNYEAVEYYLNVDVVSIPQLNSFTKGNNYLLTSQSLNISNSYVFIINYLKDSSIMRKKVFKDCGILYDNIGQIYYCGN